MTLSKHQFGDLMPKLKKRHGEDFSTEVADLAFATSEDPDGTGVMPHDLPITRERVRPANFPDWHGGSQYENANSRRNLAMKGYQENPAAVPPILLVKRAGEYEVADGTHRISAAIAVGKESIPAWVVHSPLPHYNRYEE